MARQIQSDNQNIYFGFGKTSSRINTQESKLQPKLHLKLSNMNESNLPFQSLTLAFGIENISCSENIGSDLVQWWQVVQLMSAGPMSYCLSADTPQGSTDIRFCID